MSLNMINNKTFFVKKNIFNILNKNKTKKLYFPIFPKIYPKHILFYFYLMKCNCNILKFFHDKFLFISFYKISNFFFKFSKFKKSNLTLTLFKLNLLQNNWFFNVLEFFFIPIYFRYNIFYLIENFFFTQIFVNQLTIFLFFFSQKFYFLNKFYNFSFKNEKLYFFHFWKIINNLWFYLNNGNSNHHLKNFINFLNKKSSFKKYKFLSNNIYISFQIFLNSFLYMSRTPLFNATIPTSSYNMLYLLYFNKFFFWTNDLYKKFFFEEKIFWSWHSLIIKNNPSYISYNIGQNKNSLFFLSLKEFFFSKDNFFLSKKISDKIFFFDLQLDHELIIYFLNIKLFNNSLIIK